MLHIGPHKTGTTTIQSAMHNSRARLKEQNVRYAGPYQQAYLAARTAVGARGVAGRRTNNPRVLRKLVNEVARSPQDRVIVSSEGFTGGSAEAASKIITDFGASRPVHVVVTLRPLTKIVPSQWQQFVQNGLRKDYDSWLNDVFNDADDRTVTSQFWRRHDHGALVDLWATAAGGPENLTVVVVDESDREMLMRTFERLVGVTSGTLQAPTAAANRSLTVAEIELVRRVNLQIGGEPWAKEAYAKVMKDGVSDAMQINRKPGPGEIPITTPRWALERASAIGAESAKAIRSLGVTIIGDIDRIADMPSESAVRPANAEMPTSIPLDAAILGVIGAVHGMEKARPLRSPLGSEKSAGGTGLDEVAARDLLRTVADRGVKRVKKRLPRGTS
jgi:hypothetical protein